MRPFAESWSMKQQRPSAVSTSWSATLPASLESTVLKKGRQAHRSLGVVGFQSVYRRNQWLAII